MENSKSSPLTTKINDELLESLRNITNLRESILDHLNKWVYERAFQVFDLNSKNYENLSNEIDVELDTVVESVRVLISLAIDLSANSVSIEDLLKSLGLLDFDHTQIKQVRVFTSNIDVIGSKALLAIQKRELLKIGAPAFSSMEIAYDFRALFVDKLPNSSEKESFSAKEFVGMMPVVVINLYLDDPQENTTTVSFQLTAKQYEAFLHDVRNGFEQFQRLLSQKGDSLNLK